MSWEITLGRKWARMFNNGLWPSPDCVANDCFFFSLPSFSSSSSYSSFALRASIISFQKSFPKKNVDHPMQKMKSIQVWQGYSFEKSYLPYSFLVAGSLIFSCSWEEFCFCNAKWRTIFNRAFEKFAICSFCHSFVGNTSDEMSALHRLTWVGLSAETASSSWAFEAKMEINQLYTKPFYRKSFVAKEKKIREIYFWYLLILKNFTLNWFDDKVIVWKIGK